ncbi:MAG: type II toxin-antitoxin system MqsA family antitoxin [Deltaproteobacteria bacterium]|nr:type II toxin-antitoxin system MqsA family antitoxin [Deltaproteobacteria bacterium]
MLKKDDLCPICGTGKISEQVISKNFKYKGHKITISDYHVFVCNVCKEAIVHPKTLKITEKILTDYRRKIDGLLTSDEIKSIRLKLGKTQAELATLLDVGEKNFARYENGQVTQSKTMDWLLRLLNIDPHILSKIKVKEQTDSDYIYSMVKKLSLSISGWNSKPFRYPEVYNNFEVNCEECLNAA